MMLQSGKGSVGGTCKRISGKELVGEPESLSGKGFSGKIWESKKIAACIE